MAERFRGHGRRLNDLLYVFIGAAIGAGVIFRGNYLRGVTGNAGDIGLMRVLLAALASAPKPDRAFDLLLTQTAINSLIRPLRGCGMSVEEQLDLGAGFERHREPVREWLEDFAQALLALSYRGRSARGWGPAPQPDGAIPRSGARGRSAPAGRSPRPGG